MTAAFHGNRQAENPGIVYRFLHAFGIGTNGDDQWMFLDAQVKATAQRIIADTGDVKYDSVRYDLDEAAREILSREKDNLKAEGEGFDSIFGSVAQDVHENE